MILADNEMINKAIEVIFSPILAFFKFIIGVLFSNHIVATFVFLIFVNWIAVILMKKDKKYAETAQRRVRESTLLLVALVGGSIGMYFAMFKYKHKTLHTQFAVGVPAIICLQCAFVSYLLVTKILVV